MNAKIRFLPFPTLGVVFIHIVAGYAVWRMFTTGYSTAAWIMLPVMWYLTGNGISVGYHRLFTHETYDCPLFVKKILSILGSWGFAGDALDFVSRHLQHHRFADQEGDPHSPYALGEGFLRRARGLFWAHIGSFCYTNPAPPEESGWKVPKRFLTNPILLWQKRNFWWLAIGGAFGIPLLVAGWDGVLLAGFFKVCAMWHITSSVNSFGHVFGTKAVNASGQVRESGKARNFPLHVFRGTLKILSVVLRMFSGLLGLLSIGELNNHGNHHARASSAYLGWRWYEIDPGRWLIWLAEKMSIFWNVSRPEPA